MDTFDPIFMTWSQDRCYFILTSDCQKFSLRNVSCVTFMKLHLTTESVGGVC